MTPHKWAIYQGWAGLLKAVARVGEPGLLERWLREMVEAAGHKGVSKFFMG